MNAIPDISNKLDAIENAIKAMPDYDTAINGIKDEIANLVKAVEDGNKSEADALAEIAKKIEALKGAGGTTTEVKDYVDLGLPSGLMWRKYNLGANSEYEAGNYYAWAETSPKQEYNWDTYKYCVQVNGIGLYSYTKYNKRDKLTVLQPEDDAATANLGNNYRTPTREEWKELLNKCNWEVVTKTNKNYMNPVVDYWKVTGPNGKFIILPSTGYYAGSIKNERWTSYLSATNANPTNAKTLAWDLTYTKKQPSIYDKGRIYGYPVRPVYIKK